MHSSNEADLDVAIKDFVHEEGLHFTATSNPSVKMLELSRTVGPNCTPPSSPDISGSLLDLNFNAHRRETPTATKKERKPKTVVQQPGLGMSERKTSALSECKCE